MDNYSNQVKCAIEKLSHNQIFVASELKEQYLSNIPDKTYYKILERLVNQDEIVHLSKGLYYRTEKHNGKFEPINEEDIVEYYVKDNSGIIVGERLLCEAGIDSETKNVIKLYSKKLKETRKHVSEIEIKKINVSLNEDTIPIIEALEILQHYDSGKLKEKERFVAYFKRIADTYSDEAADYVLERMNYKKSTIAFLERMLNWYGVYNSLNKHLSPLSNYKIPSVEDLRLKIPVGTQILLNEYVLGLKEIYTESINSVLLYGSYAKGNFTCDSDIDIMILLKLTDEEIKDHQHALSEMTYDFNIENDLDIKPIVKNIEHFEKWRDAYPFYKNVHSEGVELYGIA